MTNKQIFDMTDAELDEHIAELQGLLDDAVAEQDLRDARQNELEEQFGDQPDEYQEWRDFDPDC